MGSHHSTMFGISMVNSDDDTGSVDGWWCGDPDSDDDTGGPIVGPDDLDTGY